MIITNIIAVSLISKAIVSTNLQGQIHVDKIDWYVKQRTNEIHVDTTISIKSPIIIRAETLTSLQMFPSYAR